MSDQSTPLGYRVYAEFETAAPPDGVPSKVRVVESADPAKVWVFAGAGAALLDIGQAHVMFSALDEWTESLAARASRAIDTVKLISTGPDPQSMGTYQVVAPCGPPPA